MVEERNSAEGKLQEVKQDLVWAKADIESMKMAKQRDNDNHRKHM